MGVSNRRYKEFMPQTGANFQRRSFSHLLVFTLIFLMSWAPVLTAQLIDPGQLISDTLRIPVEVATATDSRSPGIHVQDLRGVPGNILGIRQVDKYWIIPVDQYLVIPDSLSGLFRRFLSTTGANTNSTLYIDKLDLWFDSKPFFSQGWMLNAETVLVGDSGDTLSVWQWEFKRKPSRKEKTAQTLSQLMQHWLFDQQSAVLTGHFYSPSVFRKYKRTLSLWTKMIFFSDGYAIDGRLSLYYPADQMDNYVRGVPGLYYRKSSYRESIAIGGNDLQFAHRLSRDWLLVFDGITRLGFNQFNPEKFDHVNWYNLFLINLGFSEYIEWSPQYHRGLYGGIGLYQSLNILPEVTDRFEPGILVTIGVRFP